MSKTHVVMLIDESGSMSSMRGDVIGGFNTYLDTLKKDKENKYLLTLALFDSGRFDVLAERKAIHNAPKLSEANYRPGSATPLYDSIAALAEKINQKPDEKTLFVIYTDGEENSSHTWNAKTVNSLIKILEGLGVTFVYMGASQEAWKNEHVFAGTIGGSNTIRSMGGAGTAAGYVNLSASTIAYASSGSSGSQTIISDSQRKEVANASGLS